MTESEDTGPFPHDELFGGGKVFQRPEGDYVFQQWHCLFEWDSGSWLATYVDEREMKLPELQGVGETPRDAFESLVHRFRLLNGGEETPALKHILPQLRAGFNEDGSARPEAYAEWGEQMDQDNDWRHAPRLPGSAPNPKRWSGRAD